ncbi:LysR family transcriptional regulator [Flavobacterium sp. JLP]|uniref:LysR family transcriptional regulator n=1 Tax=unclassified Flavobacterium TaxID=196869 RepID=UPI00188CD962|nr:MULTISPECIES: LysR family transcriptional regulator [unclassified Flavobacterium]MBF4493038.1 LysR family transcriptional regulator [Flavobacterium sp. MR2016-29]MBF4507310.1 LysR family transcriptional regulator [Flavobacterium sp. JLP]
MELRQLKYFVRAAELLNFTQAADDLYITQSTLSHQIKELENSLTVLLFDRVGKRVKLTEAGEIMLDYARKTIRQAEEGKQVLMDLNNVKTGKITIGSTYGLVNLLLQTITEFNEEFPDIQIEVVLGSTSDLMQKIRLYEIDCMLSFMPPSEDKQFDIMPLFSANLSLILHKSHPWSKLKKIGLEKITELPLVLPSPSFSIRNFLDETLLKNNIKLKAKIEINDIHSLLELVSTKKWFTVLMNSSLFDFSELIAVPIEGKNMSREATIIFPAGIYRKASILLFHNLIKKKAEMTNLA